MWIIFEGAVAKGAFEPLGSPREKSNEIKGREGGKTQEWGRSLVVKGETEG